jgi:hypothetical protein
MSEQPSLNGDGTITIKTSSWNRVVRERDEAREECKEAQYESEQQSRLLGISAEREYALRGKIFELERKILQLEAK